MAQYEVPKKYLVLVVRKIVVVLSLYRVVRRALSTPTVIHYVDDVIPGRSTVNKEQVVIKKWSKLTLDSSQYYYDISMILDSLITYRNQYPQL